MSRRCATHVPGVVARPRGAEREVDVLVVREVRGIEEADLAQHRAPEQGGAAADSRHRSVRAAQLRDGHTEIAISRAPERVDDQAGGVDYFLAAEEQGAGEQAGF